MAENDLQLVNVDGRIVAEDPETGETRPVSLGDAEAESFSTVAARTEEEPVANVKAHGAVGDGAADDYQAIQDAANAVAPAGTIYFPPGDYLCTQPVDLKGASVDGAGPFEATILADPNASDSQYVVGPQTNDVALLYNWNETGVSYQNVGVDGQEAYVAGLVAWGVAGLTVTNTHVIDCGNCGIHTFGEINTNDDPVIEATISNNVIEGCRWNIANDGTHYNLSVNGNVSRRAFSRHISVYPASDRTESGEIRVMSVADNMCRGTRSLPSSWEDDPSTTNSDSAIGSQGEGVFGHISGNYVYSWDGPNDFRLFPNSAVKITGNTAHGAATGLLVENQLDGSTVHDNTFLGHDTGIDMAGGDTNAGVIVGGNTFNAVTTEIDAPGTIPSQWTYFDNYNMSGTEVSP